MQINTHFLPYFCHLFLELKNFRQMLYRKSKYKLHSITFFKIRAVYENVEKYVGGLKSSRPWT